MHVILAMMVGAVAVAIPLTICYWVGRLFYYLIDDQPVDAVTTVISGLALTALAFAILFACYMAGSGVIDMFK